MGNTARTILDGEGRPHYGVGLFRVSSLRLSLNTHIGIPSYYEGMPFFSFLASLLSSSEILENHQRVGGGDGEHELSLIHI